MNPMSRFAESPHPWPRQGPPRRAFRRVLFLDDDPTRAEIFLAENPDAVWVPTVEECLARLAETWDEVHLDHDLGGETFVDCSREDCGMEVVRWLCLESRPHLATTQFFIHSHNPRAADLMVMQMYAAGFRVEARPFGFGPPSQAPSGAFGQVPAAHDRGWRAWLRDLGRYLFGPAR
jgi:hypothetical protein